MANKHHDNIFLRHSTHTAAPWLVKRGSKERRVIQGLHAEPIGWINQLGNPVINGEQYRANCNLIQHAPQLLAALKEAAVIIDSSTNEYTVAEAFGDASALLKLIAAAESTTLEDHLSNE